MYLTFNPVATLTMKGNLNFVEPTKNGPEIIYFLYNSSSHYHDWYTLPCIVFFVFFF